MTRESQNTLEYVYGSLVFRWQKTPNGYDSHIQIFTRRHFDNCLANGTMPWAMAEIKVKANNGEFVVNPEFSPFVDFCEDWIINPVAAQRWASDAIRRIEETASGRIREVRYADTDDNSQNNSEPEVVELSDVPFTGYKPRNLDV